MWSDIVGKPLLNQKYLPIKHWNFISKLAIFSDSRYTTLKHPFLIISLPSFQRIWLYSHQDTPVPQPLLVSPVLQPTQISVSYTLIPASRVLSWALFNSLLVTTIETWPLTFCPLCLVIPLWVNLVFTFFTPIPELPRGIRESQINIVLPWKKIMSISLIKPSKSFHSDTHLWCPDLVSQSDFQTFPLSSSLQPNSPSVT